MKWIQYPITNACVDLALIAGTKYHALDLRIIGAMVGHNYNNRTLASTTKRLISVKAGKQNVVRI